MSKKSVIDQMYTIPGQKIMIGHLHSEKAGDGNQAERQRDIHGRLSHWVPLHLDDHVFGDGGDDRIMQIKY